MMFRKHVDRQEDGDKVMKSNRPNKRKVLNHFLTSDCFAHSPLQHKMESWCLPIRIPNDTTETVELIRKSLTQFSSFRNLTEQEREAAWVKLSNAAKKHGIDAPTKMPTVQHYRPATVTASHRITW